MLWWCCLYAPLGFFFWTVSGPFWVPIHSMFRFSGQGDTMSLWVRAYGLQSLRLSLCPRQIKIKTWLRLRASAEQPTVWMEHSMATSEPHFRSTPTKHIYLYHWLPVQPSWSGSTAKCCCEQACKTLRCGASMHGRKHVDGQNLVLAC